MADFVSGIRNITPSYPVRPVQPAKRDEERKDKRQQPDSKDSERVPPDSDETGRRQIIDEHV